MTETDLKSAYALEGPEDARALYRDWAETYDTSFGEAHGYVAPREVARIYAARAEGLAPVLDVGAGTGLVAEHLARALAGGPIDGFDLSPEMLEVARGKGVYRDLIVGDLLQPLALEDGSYGGVVSAGTFTHGHVGPGCLPELIRVARPGALFACGCIPPVFDGMGFGSVLARLQAAGEIGPLEFEEIALYEGKDHAHAEDRGLVMIFRKS